MADTSAKYGFWGAVIAALIVAAVPLFIHFSKPEEPPKPPGSDNRPHTIINNSSSVAMENPEKVIIHDGDGDINIDKF